MFVSGNVSGRQRAGYLAWALVIGMAPALFPSGDEFGPVALVYTDGPIWQELQDPYCTVVLHCKLHSNNEAALQQACRLKQTSSIIYRFIMEENGGIVWNGPELLRECERRSSTQR